MKLVTNALAREYSEQVTLFREWCLEEWKSIDSFDAVHKGMALPDPVLALRNSELVGGLAFTWSKLSGTNEVKLWVNAIIVSFAFRRKGIASKLIRAAENNALQKGQQELFAFTDIPVMYQKLGWSIVSSSSKGIVVKKGVNT